jgi:hypothetical protein
MKALATLTAALLVSTTGLSMAHSMQRPMMASTSVSAAAAMPLVNGEVRKLDPAIGSSSYSHW